MSQNDHFYQKINKRKSDGQKDELMARGTRLYIQIHVFTFIVWWVFHGQGHKESGKSLRNSQLGTEEKKNYWKSIRPEQNLSFFFILKS